MNESNFIHETVVRDIVDIVQTVTDDGYIAGMLNRSKSFKSPTHASSNLILTFPVLVSKAIPIDVASMISKAIERKATSLMQILFSAVCMDNADNAIDFVKKYHTNLGGSGSTLDDFMDTIDKMVMANEMTLGVDQTKYNAIMEDLRNISKVLPSNISECGINEYYVQNRYGDTSIVHEDPDSIRRGSAQYYAQQYSSARDVKDSNSAAKDRLIDTDVKKANELMPTLMVINIISTAEDEPVNIGNIVIGIKAKLYTISSDDIINRIKIKNQDRNGFHQFIRAATREISFWKDFVFAIDKAKIDAISQSKRGSSSKMWKVLERRAIKSRLRRALGQANDASAITTLTISQEEVEYLKVNENINIENPAVLRPIMESYNLMGFCIVDESVESAKFLFDTGDDEFETISFTHLEREASDSTYKKVVNLMSKVSR